MTASVGSGTLQSCDALPGAARNSSILPVLTTAQGSVGGAMRLARAVMPLLAASPVAGLLRQAPTSPTRASRSPAGPPYRRRPARLPAGLSQPSDARPAHGSDPPARPRA